MPFADLILFSMKSPSIPSSRTHPVRLLALATMLFSTTLFAAHHEGQPMKKDAMARMMEHGHEMESPAGAPTLLIAVLQPTAGNDVEGVVHFEKVEDGIQVSGKVTGLTPGEHGFHVHQWGNITAADGTATGGHFNPTGKPHGAPNERMRHVGDLGNIVANDDGVAEFSFIDEGLKFQGPASIIGRGLIVHAGRDDLTSQPTGAAGARVAQAVIGVADNRSEK